jgi:hypothetical protein
MMKKQLLSTVTAALLLTGGAATAASDQPIMPERAPAAQQKAPAEKIAPPMHAGERKAQETTGQAVKEPSPGKSEMRGKNETSGQSAQEPGAARSDMKAKSDHKSDMSQGLKDESSKQSSKDTSDANRKAEGTKSDWQSQKSSESSKSSTTGQGAAAGSAKLTNQQRTKITTVIKKQKVKSIEASQLNVSIRVGAVVPASVHFYPLPTEVVEIYPEWRGYDFILVGDEIIIIEPHRHAIVAVLAA